MDSISFKPISDVGLIRDNNEDSFIAEQLWDKYHFLFAAIDGIGGYEGGEVAAEIARTSIIEFLHNYPDNNLKDLIVQAVLQANNSIYEQRKLGQYPNMGCVVSAAILDTQEDKLYIAHVGDSRIYLYNNGELTKLTHDHSLVGYREEIGELTEEEAMKHPRRNIIERCLGDNERIFGEGNFIENTVYDIPANGKLLFCSDGLTDLVTSVEIKLILGAKASTADKCQKLVDKAKEHGGKDNITVVLAETRSKSFSQKEANLSCGQESSENTNAVLPAEDRIWRSFLPLACLIFGIFIGFCVGMSKYQPLVVPKICTDSLETLLSPQDSLSQSIEPLKTSIDEESAE